MANTREKAPDKYEAYDGRIISRTSHYQLWIIEDPKDGKFIAINTSDETILEMHPPKQK